MTWQFVMYSSKAFRAGTRRYGESAENDDESTRAAD